MVKNLIILCNIQFLPYIYTRIKRKEFFMPKCNICNQEFDSEIKLVKQILLENI